MKKRKNVKRPTAGTSYDDDETGDWEPSRIPTLRDCSSLPESDSDSVLHFAMAKPNSSETSIKERRLRPIYDLLDGCNNKRAVQEVDRLLKKQPNFTCAKVLKALALLRMNKSQECLAIITPIIEENPTEDNTLQALSICYRELDQPEKVCQLYENACKIEQSEDMLTQCFLAYVRVGDFQNQYQAAMKLYKTFKKGPYFCWAIMSLVAQSHHNPESSDLRVALPLAERMMTKFIDESKSETEKETTLFILILQKQKNYSRLLEILENTVKPTISAATGLYHQLKIECLQETQQMEMLAQYLESSILRTPNEWQYYSEYIGFLESIGEPRVNSFLRKALDLYRCEIPPKSTLLSFFMLNDTLAKSSKPAKDSTFVWIEKYFKHYGHKASCFMDIAPFLGSVPLNQFVNAIPPSDSTGEGAFSVHSLRRITNYLHLIRCLMTVDKTDILEALEKCRDSVQTYAEVQNHFTKQQFSECTSVVELLKLAALYLTDSFWFDSSPWKGLYQTLQAENPETDVAKHVGFFTTTEISAQGGSEQKPDCSQTDSVSNGVAHQTVTYHIEEKDFPVLLCSCLLTYALDEAPSNSQVRLILSKLYIRCGAIGAAMDTLQKLDLKYIQYESVGYIYIWKLAQCGHLTEGLRTLKLAETFYGVYQKESVEHILSGYKYGAWTRVLEFTEFRKRLLNSVQSYLIKFESKLLEYCRDGWSRSQILQLKQAIPSISNDFASIPWDKLTDGRDLHALMDFTPSRGVDRWKEVTFKAEVLRLRVRGLLLMLINDAIGITQEEMSVKSCVCNIIANIKAMQEVIGADLQQYVIDEEIPIDGMWRPRIVQYIRFGHVDVLLKYFYLVCNTIRDSSSASVAETAHEIVAFCSNRLVLEIRSIGQNVQSLFEISEGLQNTYDILETLSFCCILTDVLSHILNKELSMKEKGKKRRGKGVGSPSTYYQTFHCLHASIKNCYTEIYYQLSCQNARLYYDFSSTWEGASGFCEKSIGKNTLMIIRTTLPTVLLSIRESYLKSIKEITSHIRSKMKYLNSIHIQYSSDN